MRICFIAVLATASFVLPASAQTIQPAAFCDRSTSPDGVQGPRETLVQSYRRRCQPGDVISFNGPTAAHLLPELCDFDKQIVLLEGTVFCAMTGSRERR